MTKKSVTRPNVTHPGTVRIGDVSLPCANLSNGQRILTAVGLGLAFGSSKKSPNKSGSPQGSANLPAFLGYGSIHKHVSAELRKSLRSPLEIVTEFGNVAYAYDAELLPAMCEAILDAERAGDLKPGTRVATAATSLYRGLVRIGIVALVDEATGFQKKRESNYLQTRLELFLKEEQADWQLLWGQRLKRAVCRLYGWTTTTKAWPPQSASIMSMIYRMALGEDVAKELKRRTPEPKGGDLQQQWFEDGVRRLLEKDLVAVEALAEAANTPSEFRQLLRYRFKGESYQSVLVR